MLIDGLLAGAGAFGAAAFCFAAGMVTAGSGNARGSVYPGTHVVFEKDISDEEKLAFLEVAAQAVRRGELHQPESLGDRPNTHTN